MIATADTAIARGIPNGIEQLAAGALAAFYRCISVFYAEVYGLFDCHAISIALKT